MVIHRTPWSRVLAGNAIPERCAVCGFGGATRMSDRNVGFHNLALCWAQMDLGGIWC